METCQGFFYSCLGSELVEGTSARVVDQVLGVNIDARVFKNS